MCFFERILSVPQQEWAAEVPKQPRLTNPLKQHKRRKLKQPRRHHNRQLLRLLLKALAELRPRISLPQPRTTLALLLHLPQNPPRQKFLSCIIPHMAMFAR